MAQQGIYYHAGLQLRDGFSLGVAEHDELSFFYPLLGFLHALGQMAGEPLHGGFATIHGIGKGHSPAGGSGLLLFQDNNPKPGPVKAMDNPGSQLPAAPDDDQMFHGSCSS